MLGYRPYTGVGSRETPTAVLNLMTDVAEGLAFLGYTVRTGGANGADTAFEDGARLNGNNLELFLPWPGFNGRVSEHTKAPATAYLAAARVHPLFGRLGPGPQALHARNAQQVLGANLDSPAQFLVCWTKDGARTADECSALTGGTGTAIKLAHYNNVPVFNLKRPATLDAFRYVAEVIQQFRSGKPSPLGMDILMADLISNA